MLHSSEIGPCRLQPMQFILNCMRQARGTNDFVYLRGRALLIWNCMRQANGTNNNHMLASGDML